MSLVVLLASGAVVFARADRGGAASRAVADLAPLDPAASISPSNNAALPDAPSPRGTAPSRSATTPPTTRTTRTADARTLSGDVARLERASPDPADRRPKGPRPGRRLVPESGSGEFVVARVPAELSTSSAPDPTPYRIEVEQGVPLELRNFANSVNRILSDPRSWRGAGSDDALTPTRSEAEFRVVLASPDTTDQLCAPLDTRGRVSCRNGTDVVINAWRWFNGAESYGRDLRNYRRYVINHEVGHALGNRHSACPARGEPAPVMLQQTYGLDGCVANAWPRATELHE